MKPQDLRDLIGRMTAGEWFTSPHIDQQRLTIDDAAAIKTLRNLAPALVELWEAVEAYRDACDEAERLGAAVEAAFDAEVATGRDHDEAHLGAQANAAYDAKRYAHDALLAAAKRVGESS